jgi:site-specific recombinase XerD
LPDGALGDGSIVVTNTGARAEDLTLSFFTANIENDNTRRAYGRALAHFLSWLHAKGVGRLDHVTAPIVAAYREHLSETRRRASSRSGRKKGRQPASVNLALAAMRSYFDYLIVGGVLTVNPARAVKGPREKVRGGKTPVLTPEQAGEFLASIAIKRDDGTPDVVALRDRALIALMLYTFGRVGAVLKLDMSDLSCGEDQWTVTLHEKGGTVHTMPLHRRARAYLKAYLQEAEISDGPVFRALDLAARGSEEQVLSERPLAYQQAYEAVKRRAKAAGLDPAKVCNHSFRATGITTYLDNGGKLESAQNMAAHASIKTTKLYDRRAGLVTEDDVELIRVPMPRHEKG